MTELDFAGAFGPSFWVLMAVVTLALMVMGYWLAGLISRKTDTGFGAFMIVVLVTIMVASAVIPMAIFGAIGDIMAVANPFAPVNDELIVSQGVQGFQRMMVAIIVSFGSVVGFFIASVIGLARGPQ